MRLLIPLLLLTACSHSGALKSRAEAVLVLDRDARRDEAALGRAAERLPLAALTPERLRSYDVRTLEVTFQALAAAEDRLGREDLLAPMSAIFTELLENRNGHVFDFHETLFQRYVARRDWASARALHAQLELDELLLPEIVERPVSGPAVYEVSEDGKTLTLKAVDLSSGSRIVSVVSPACHFSEDARKAILADPQLAPAFAELSLNVYPGSFSLDAEALAKANAAGPVRYVILHKAAAWPGLDFGGTPHFYFFKDGRQVDSVIGWREPGSRERLRAAVTKLR